MMEKLDNLKFLGRLLEMNIDYYQHNMHKKIQGLLPKQQSNRIYSILNVCVDQSFNLVRDSDNYYLVISFGNDEYLVMQPAMSAPLYSSKNLALFTLTPQVKPVLQFAYQLLKGTSAPDWPLYSFYLDDIVAELKPLKEFLPKEEKEMQDNLAGLLDAFNKLDEDRMIYYLRSKLRSKQYVLLKKIDVAKKLLMTTDFSLKYIAMRLSFTTTSHFIQVFKSIVGLTPKQYSKQLVEKVNTKQLQ